MRIMFIVVMLGCGTPAKPTPAALVPVDQKRITENDLDNETIGGLASGTLETAVTAALGEPKDKTEPQTMAASGEVVSMWTWPGVSLEMAKRPEGYQVNSITITPPSKLATSRGITIGSLLADVEKHYERGKEAPVSAESFLVGSPYGGLLFRIDAGKVSEIFMGAMAE